MGRLFQDVLYAEGSGEPGRLPSPVDMDAETVYDGRGMCECKMCELGRLAKRLKKGMTTERALVDDLAEGYFSALLARSLGDWPTLESDEVDRCIGVPTPGGYVEVIVNGGKRDTMKKKKKRDKPVKLPEKFAKAARRVFDKKIKNVYLAASAKADEYAEEIGALLNAMGIKSAMVTDESTIGDFDGAFDDLDELSEAIGIELSMNDYVWKVGKKIREKTALN